MQRPRILIVEDETIIAMDLESSLKGLGYEVTSIVSTGEEAIEKAEAENPDLILMDIRVEGEMDGIEAAAEIRGRFDIPVIFSTAYLDAERLDRAKVTMPFGYLLKPIQNRDLRVTIEMALYVAKVEFERKKSEKKLKDQEKRYKISFDTNPDAVSITRLDGLYVDINNGFTEMSGYSRDEVIGKLSADIDIWENPTDRVRFIAELKAHGKVKNMETRFRCKNGSLITTLISSSLIDLNEEQHVLLITKDITNRINTENALKESQFLFSQMFEQSTTATCLHSADGTIIRVNPEFSKMFGVEAEEITAGRYNLFQDPEISGSQAEPLLREIFEQKRTNNWISTYNLPAPLNAAKSPSSTKTKLELEVFGYPVLDSENNLKFVVLQHYDVSERKQSEIALKESQHRLSAYREQTPLGILELNNQMEITTWNPAAEKIFGHAADEAVGQNALDLIVPDYEHDAVLEIHSRSEPGTIENINDNLTRDGKTITCLWLNTPIFNSEGAISGMTAVCQDISGKLKTERELQILRSRLDNIFNSMPSILIGVDIEGTITDWNLQAEEATGISATHATGMKFTKILPEYSRHIHKIKAAIQNRRPEITKKTMRYVNDLIRFEDIIVYPLIDNGIQGAVVRIDDVTEQAKMEKVLIQTEKMMSVGGLAAGIAHELNNPLGGILQAVQNIERRLSPHLNSNQEPAREYGIDLHKLQQYMQKRRITHYFDGVKEAGQKSSQIISSMLKFSRKSESNVVQSNLPSLIDNVLRLVQTDYNLKNTYDFRYIDIVKEYEANIPLVPCTETEIEQVILNLLNNAAWAMKNDSKSEQSKITLRLKRLQEVVQLEVEDNGPGIDNRVQEKVFEPFFTTKPVGEGTGLGLSVSYTIITNNHHGEMEVNSEPGKGTCFTINLPLYRDEVA